MSEFEDPQLLDSARVVSVDDVRELAGAATPHFAMHVRGRLLRVIADLPADDPARKLAELEIERLEKLATDLERGSAPADLPRL